MSGLTIYPSTSSGRTVKFCPALNGKPKMLFCRWVNAYDNQEIVHSALNAQSEHTALMMAKLYQEKQDWILQLLGRKTRALY